MQSFIRGFLGGAVLTTGLLLPGTVLSAQTGLVIAASSGHGWTPSVEALALQTRWSKGPTALFLWRSSATDSAGWSATVDTLMAAGARAIVVVPVAPEQAPADGFHTSLRRMIDRQPIRVPVYLAESVGIDSSWSTDHAARRVDLVAYEGAATLLTSLAGAAGQTDPIQLRDINVTATRDPTDGFDTPMAVTVIGARLVKERLPNSATDLFTEIRGLDVDGVGTTQRQPMIRGLQGQRILLMEDGLRINNTRRQQDRGEIPALIDIGEVDRVEVVRGASSVLYGSDAIGGVINMITPRPGSSSGKSVNGEVLLRGGTADDQTLVAAKLFGDVGSMSYRATGSYRSTNPYQAPPGTFGDVTFSQNTLVHDTGVDDYSVSGTVGYRFSERHDGFAKGEAYRSSDTGFGYVDPADLGTESFVQLLFPRQRFGRLTLGYRGQQLGSVLADNLDVLGYWQNNTRDFHTNIVSPIPPSGELRVESRNFTDIDTYGYRIEAKKLIGGRHLLTYGTDLFRDHSVNTDTTVTTVSGFGPPNETVRDVARVPNATYRSVGFFAQATIPLGSRATTTVGARYQNVRAQPETTPRWDALPPASTDDAAVGSVNVIVRASRRLNLVASLGRGFRSPNLVERFFTGSAPDGRGMWVGNSDLAPETSLNAELGLRYRTDRVYLEGFVFQNTIDDAIRAVATGDSVAGVPEFQNVNVDRLRYRGVEITLDVALVGGFAVAGSYTHLSPTNLESPADPLGDGYRDKVLGRLRWSDAGRGLWVEYTIRHNGQQQAANLVQGPVGAVIPAFTDHGIRGGVRFLRRQEVVVALTNLSNALYAESANVAFFRPAPKRSLAVTWRLAF